MARVQVSAEVAESTKALLDRFSAAHGVKKGHLLEEALLHHLRALEELPADVIIPARVIVDRRTGDDIVERLKRPTKPTRAMRDLMGE